MTARVKAQRPARERLGVVEAALDTQVRGAVESPAPYLTDLLGPRPSRQRGRQRWDEVATVIEAYRHLELGMAPAAGPLLADDNALLAAVGRRPEDYLQSLTWERTVREVPGRELAVERPSPALVLEL